MICYVLAMGKQNLGPHVVVGYGIKMFWPGLFITSPDHLGVAKNGDQFFVGGAMAAWLVRSTPERAVWV